MAEHWLARLSRCVCLSLSVVTAGCSATKNAALDIVVDSLAEGGDSIRGHFDWETAGHGAASSIIQLEALYALRPGNEQLALALTKSYMAYTYGWVMDEAGEADLAEDFEAAEHHRLRSYWMYTRARNIALGTLRRRDEGIDKVLYGDPDKLLAYLRREYTDPEEDVAPLFWTMISWSSSINADPESESFVNMPAVRAMARRVIELDEDYEDAGAVVFMGGFWSSYPRTAGGDPEKGKAYFERALQLTGRRNHIILINYATMYAINAPDRKLFHQLLMEILTAPDQGNATRLSNKVARRRAERLIQRIDEFF